MRRTTNELILTGRPDAVDRLLTRAERKGHLRRAITQQQGNRTLQLGLLDAAQSDARDLTHQLAAMARTERAAVRAEPNCATGHPFRMQQGARDWGLDPWQWDENPWQWDENPWQWDENPWQWDENPRLPTIVPAGTTPAEGATLFATQSAFGQIGLTDAAGQRNPALADHLGEGVLVGLFDALPATPVNLPWLTLHPSQNPGPEQPWDDRDLSDHGLITASLVNAVAPRAEVHLYEACGKDGHGRLFPLLEALSAFISLAGQTGRPAVISLSLGSLCMSGSAALRTLLQQATDMGLVVCAAAGNAAHGTPKVSALLPAQVPAAFPNVIAVAAANRAEQRASYSQRGDIAAPGGEDLNRPGPDDAEDIIGLGVSVGTSGYVRIDAGTSFATPLVAGAAALLLEGRVNRPATTYQEVLARLQAAARHPAPPAAGETLTSAGLGGGILQLPGLF